MSRQIQIALELKATAPTPSLLRDATGEDCQGEVQAEVQLNIQHSTLSITGRCPGSSRLVRRRALFAVQLDSVPPPALGVIHGLIRACNERLDSVNFRR